MASRVADSALRDLQKILAKIDIAPVGPKTIRDKIFLQKEIDKMARHVISFEMGFGYPIMTEGSHKTI